MISAPSGEKAVIEMSWWYVRCDVTSRCFEVFLLMLPQGLLAAVFYVSIEWYAPKRKPTVCGLIQLLMIILLYFAVN